MRMYLDERFWSRRKELPRKDRAVRFTAVHSPSTPYSSSNSASRPALTSNCHMMAIIKTNLRRAMSDDACVPSTSIKPRQPMRKELTMERRLFLALALGLCLLRVSSVTSAQSAAELPFTLKQVGPNVWAAISNPKSTTSAGANTGFVIGDDGVAVIDATLNAEADGSFRPIP